MTTKAENVARARANRQLQALPNYHPFIPCADIDTILTNHGFNQMEAAIYCGREGTAHEQVGQRTWITMTWYRMEETGRYEIVTYLS